MKTSSSPSPAVGTLVTRKHKCPQCRRHGVVVEVFGAYASVKFHGMSAAKTLPLSKLDFVPEK